MFVFLFLKRIVELVILARFLSGFANHRANASQLRTDCNNARAAIEKLNRSWQTDGRTAVLARTLEANEGGIFLGATRLAPRAEGFEQKIHALVSYFIGAPAPASLSRTLISAIADYRSGELAKSAMRLALAFPTQSNDEENCRKLHIAAGLIEDGLLSTDDLLALAGIASWKQEPLVRYDPNQPRAPAGNSDGGQWTSEDSGTSTAARDKTN